MYPPKRKQIQTTAVCVWEKTNKQTTKTHNNEQMHNSATLNSTAVQHGEHNVQQREASGRQRDTQYDTYPLCALQNKMRFRKSGAQESDRAATYNLF